MSSRGNSLVWISALLLSALAWGEPVHIIPVTTEDFQKAVEQVQAPAGKRPEGLSKAMTAVKLLKALDGTAGPVATDALDHQALYDTYIEQFKALRTELTTYREQAYIIALNQNKPLLDKEADAALKLELDILETKYIALMSDLRNDKLEIPEIRERLVELIVRMNADRVLLAYGSKMLELTKDGKHPGLEPAESRVKALQELQQAEAKEPKVVKSLITTVGGKDIYHASPRTKVELNALTTIFSVKVDQFDPDTLTLAQDILFERHIKGTINKAYEKNRKK